MGLKRGPKLEVIGAIIGLVVAVASAWGMRDRVRAVDILALFAGGFGAGVGLILAITKLRAARAAKNA